MATNQRKVNDKLIIALDVPDLDPALALAEQLAPHAGFFKVGMELFTRCGPSVVSNLQSLGTRVFLDLKFHDIPNTVAGAVRSACALDVDFLTIHLAGGPDMVEAAVKAAEGSGTVLLGVTVLTSSDRANLDATGIRSGAVEDQVLRLARIGIEAGIGGLVASPQEITLLRQIFGTSPRLVIPGVRPSWAASDDQKRILSPREAIEKGADHLVVGRPVTRAVSPADAANQILNEITPHH